MALTAKAACDLLSNMFERRSALPELVAIHNILVPQELTDTFNISLANVAV